MSSIHLPKFEDSTDPFLNPDVWCEQSELLEWVEHFYDFPAWSSIHGLYQISSHGNVRMSATKTHHGHKREPRILKPHKQTRNMHNDNDPVMKVRLTVCTGQKYDAKVTDLLNLAFADTLRAKGIQPTPVPQQLLKSYCDEHYSDYRTTRKAKIDRRKFSEDFVRDIRRRFDAGERLVDITKDVGISASAVRKIAIRESYKDVK